MNGNRLETMSQSVTSRPVLYLFITTVILVLSLIPVRSLTFNSSYSIWFLKNDPAVQDFEKFKKDYNWSPSLLIGYESVSHEQLESLLEWLQNKDFFSKVSIFPGKPLISAKVKYSNENDFASVNRKIVNQVKSHLKTYDTAFHLGGIASTNAFYENSRKDRMTLSPIFAGIILIFLAFFFTTAAGLLIPLTVIGLTACVTYGILGWMNWPLNVLNSVLILIVVAVSISDCVHYLTEFYHFRREGMNQRQAAEASFKSIFIPCFFTTLTTSAGFFSLSLSELQPVREFGFCAAIGVWFAFFFTFFTIPVLLLRSRSVADERKLSLSSLINLCKRFRWPVAVLAALMTIAAFTQFSYIKTESSYRHYFKKNSVAGKDIDWFVKETGIAEYLNVIIDLEDKSLDSDDLILFKKIKAEILKDKHISSVISPSDLILPQLIQNSGLTANDGSSAILTVNISSLDDAIFQEVLKGIKSILDRICEGRYTLTGQSLLASNMNNFINKGVTDSFLAAAAIIAVCLIVSLKDLNLAALALLLSLWPLLLTTAIMPLAGISLNLTTMMIAAITFSTVVDDNIHIMSKYIEGIKSGLNRTSALEYTMRRSGTAVLISNLILGLGFAINIFGYHNPTHQFGILASVIVILALIADTALFIALVSIKAGKEVASS